jgi:hypothetical protein
MRKILAFDAKIKLPLIFAIEYIVLSHYTSNLLTFRV